MGKNNVTTAGLFVIYASCPIEGLDVDYIVQAFKMLKDIGGGGVVPDNKIVHRNLPPKLAKNLELSSSDLSPESNCLGVKLALPFIITAGNGILHPAYSPIKILEFLFKPLSGTAG